LCSSVWSARNSGSTDNRTTPGRLDGLGEQVHTRPSSAISKPVTRDSPEDQSRRPRSEAGRHRRMKRALLEHGRRGPRVEHARLDGPKTSGMVVQK